MGNLAWIWFDLGGTLIDESRAHGNRIQRTVHLLSSWGTDITEDALAEACGRAAARFAPSQFKGALTTLGLTVEQMRQVAEYAPYRKDLEFPFDGVEEVLAALTQRYRLGVLANQSAGTEDRLLQYGIREYFDSVLASAEVGIGKPDERFFRLAMERSGCSPKQMAMVGDRLDNDIGPAKRAGWWTVRVLHGFSCQQVARNAEERADRVVEDLRDLPGCLEAL